MQTPAWQLSLWVQALPSLQLVPLGASATSHTLPTHTSTLHGPTARRFDLTQSSAVEVVAVEPGGPAAQAGIEADDLIVTLGDAPVESVDDLHRLLTQLPVGVPSAIVILRGQKRLERFVLPEEYPHWDPARR